MSAVLTLTRHTPVCPHNVLMWGWKTDHGMGLSRRALLSGLTTVSLAGCLRSSGANALTIGIVPDVDPDTAISKNTALADYLESALGRPIELQTASEYAGLVQAMATDQLSVAYFGGVSYMLAHERASATPFVVGKRDGTTNWHTSCIVPSDAPQQSMADVVESASSLELVFGDPISTSGTVMPTYYFETKFDLTPTTAFASVTHTGAHDATAKTVGATDGTVGTLNARIFERLREEDSADTIREIWRSPGFVDYPWAVGPSVSASLRADLQEAFTSLSPDEHEEILASQNVDEYVSISHEAFTSLETAVEMAGVDL